MNEENVILQRGLEIQRKFLRNIYHISGSKFRLRNSLGKATLAQLRVLIGILRATSKGWIPMKKHRYEQISAARSFSKVIALKDEIVYRELCNLSRSGIVEFTYKLLNVWKLYLDPLFDENE